MYEDTIIGEQGVSFEVFPMYRHFCTVRFFTDGKKKQFAP